MRPGDVILGEENVVDGEGWVVGGEIPIRADSMEGWARPGDGDAVLGPGVRASLEKELLKELCKGKKNIKIVIIKQNSVWPYF